MINLKAHFMKILIIVVMLFVALIMFIVGYYRHQSDIEKVTLNDQPLGALLITAKAKVINVCKEDKVDPDTCEELQLYDMTSYQNDFEQSIRYVFYFSNSNRKTNNTVVYSVSILGGGRIVEIDREPLEHLNNGKPVSSRRN